MAIVNFNEDDLTLKLGELLSASDPIRSREFLIGRETNLRDIRRQLAVQGRHVFIFGDRGVGKTSLALTAAFEFHNSSSAPIMVAGGLGETFYSLISSITKKVYAHNKQLMSGKTTAGLGIKIPFISADIKKEFQSGRSPTINSLNDAVDALSWVSAQYDGIPVLSLMNLIESKLQKIRHYLLNS